MTELVQRSESTSSGPHFEICRRILLWASNEVGTASLLDKFADAVELGTTPPFTSPTNGAVAGPVVLLRLSRRTDAAPGGGTRPRSRTVRMIREHVFPGSVVLLDASISERASIGSKIAQEMMQSGAMAAFSSGYIRDTDLIRRMPFVIGANGVVAATAPGQFEHMPVEGPADFLGLQWRSGDWLLKDADGVIRVPCENVGHLVEALEQDDRKELATFELSYWRS